MARFSIPLTGFLLLCCCLLSALRLSEADYFKYKDPKQPLNARIRDLMRRMTLAEKIGQMTQIERSVATPDVMNKYFIGSVLSGGGSEPAPKASAEAWVNLVNGLQKGSLSTRLGIPMIYGIDAVHGHNNVYNATIFPHNVGLGVTRDPNLVKRIGEATALEVRATGIPYVFAPCIAVCRDPRWGRCYESYSEDHKIVQAMTEIIPGLQGDMPPTARRGAPYVSTAKGKVAACAKHYVGDGGTTKGINENNTVIDLNGLLSIHMPAYLNSIRKGVATVMVSYSSWNGNKMHANKELITGYLKDKLRFRGFVISDWEGIDRITSPPKANYSYSVQAGVGAGIDMIMVPYNFTDFIDDLTYQVKNNMIPMSRIDDAVQRILRVKFVMGLFENPLADLSLASQLGNKVHRELAREAVRKSLVLLKNGKSAYKPVLPLPKKAGKILVAGSHADNLGNQCGGWTITWQGLEGNDHTMGTTILSAVKSTVDPTTQVVYNENPDANFVKSNKFSYAIVVVGEPPYSETFGDSLNLTIPQPGPSTIANVCGAVKCVVVVISGRHEGRSKSFKPNKEEDDKMRTTAANVAARAAVGGDDMLSKWQLMAEQARQKREGGIDVASGSQPGKDVNRKPTLSAGRTMKDNQEAEKRSGGTPVASAAGTIRKCGKNQVNVPQTKVARSISVKDVIAVLEREPQMSRSTLIYRLFERVQSNTTGE